MRPGVVQSDRASTRSPRKIVVGYDGTDAAQDALVLAVRLAEALDGRLVLADVYPHEYPPFRGDAGAYERVMREDAEEALAAAPAPPDVERRAIPASSPARGLHAAAENEDVILVVVGSARHGRVGRVALGSVTRAMLHGTPCPVAVAPAGYARGEGSPLRRIVVGYVDTDEARGAVRVAAALAEGAGASLRLVSAAEPLRVPLAHRGETAWADYAATVRETLRKSLEEAMASVPSGVEVSGTVLDGHPADRLREEAEQGADLLVTGSRGYGALGQVLLGSVAAKLVEDCPVPVLVVPRGATRAPVTVRAAASVDAD